MHYVVSLNDKRLRLSEYKRFSNFKFEIQIRTVLQHSWAEIEHDIGYKNDVFIPEFAKRTFYRVAALLETADLEFVKLKDILKEYEKSVGAEIDINPESVLVDQVSLLTYMTTSKRIIELDEEFSKWSKVPILDNDAEHSAGALSHRLIGVGITTIKQLDDFINHNSKELFELYKRDAVDFGPLSGLSKGMIIYQIDLYIKGKSAKDYLQITR